MPIVFIVFFRDIGKEMQVVRLYAKVRFFASFTDCAFKRGFPCMGFQFPPNGAPFAEIG